MLALFVALVVLFAAAAFRGAALAGLFTTPEPRAVVPIPEAFRFRLASFVSTVFILARIVLLVPRATRVFDAGLLLPTCFRTRDDDATLEDGALEARFEAGLTRDRSPIFLVFELAGFFDFLRAAILNLSTRET